MGLPGTCRGAFVFYSKFKKKDTTVAQENKRVQGHALAEPGGPWRPTFAPGRLENLRFFIQIICWAPWILQVQSTGRPSIFLRAQPWGLIPGCENILCHPQQL